MHAAFSGHAAKSMCAPPGTVALVCLPLCLRVPFSRRAPKIALFEMVFFLYCGVCFLGGGRGSKPGNSHSHVFCAIV